MYWKIVLYKKKSTANLKAVPLQDFDATDVSAMTAMSCLTTTVRILMSVPNLILCVRGASAWTPRDPTTATARPDTGKDVSLAWKINPYFL